jgi:hypothetical protein
MSLIKRTNRSVFCTAISTIHCPFSGNAPNTPLSNKPKDPRIDVNGVRS